MRIPSHVKIKNRVSYEIVWVDSFKSDTDKEITVGEARPEHKQIALRKGQSEKALMKTLIHELIHCIEFERGIKIPHKTVYQLEGAI